MTQSFAKSVNQMYRNKSPYVYNRTSNDQYPESKNYDPNAQRYRGNSINPHKNKNSLYSVETEKRDQVLNVGNARQQKSYIGSFGYSENNDNSPQIYEAVEI